MNLRALKSNSMNYQLAKKLKQAGFQASLDDNAEYYLMDDVIVLRKEMLGLAKHANGDNVAMNLWVYKPNLEKLIAALPKLEKQHFILRRLNTHEPIFIAALEEANTETFVVTAPNPEQAVAELWLQLNGN